MVDKKIIEPIDATFDEIVDAVLKSHDPLPDKPPLSDNPEHGAKDQ